MSRPLLNALAAVLVAVLIPLGVQARNAQPGGTTLYWWTVPTPPLLASGMLALESRHCGFFGYPSADQAARLAALLTQQSGDEYLVVPAYDRYHALAQRIVAVYAPDAGVDEDAYAAYLKSFCFMTFPPQ